MSKHIPADAAADARRAAEHTGRGDVGRARGQITNEVVELHRLLVESVTDYAIIALDPDGCILSWNEGARRIKGYEAQEVIGKHFSIFYPPELVAARAPEHELEVAADVDHFEDEGWRVRKDGSHFWANVVVTALRSDDGELVGFAKVTRDLTERRREEQGAWQSVLHVLV